MQPGERDRIRARGGPQRALVLRGGLPVRFQPGSPARRGGRVPQYRRAVARRLGVEGEASVVVAAERAQRGQHQPVNHLAPMAGDGMRHRQPGDLVAEPDPRAVGDQQAALQQLVEDRWRAAGHRLQQPRLDPGPGQRRDIQHLARPGAEPRRPRQHRVACRRGYLFHAGPQHFRHVERVPAGQPVQLGRGQAAPAGQRPHRARGQRHQPDAPGTPLRAEIAERHAEPVGGGQAVVPVGGDEQHRGVAQPPAQVAEQVEGGLVGPVDVLDDDHVQHPRRAEHAEQRAEQFLAAGPGPAALQQRAAELIRQVEQRPERARREQAVAHAPRPASIRQIPAQPLDQRRLPHSRLAAEQDQPPLAAGRLRRVLVQQRQRPLAFQQRWSGLDRRLAPDPHPRPSPVRKGLYVNRRTTRPRGSVPPRPGCPGSLS